MTEEVKIPSKEELLTGGEQTQQEEVHSQEESLAMESGWVPKDQWKGSPEDWRPAKEFNDRGELFARIKEQSKQLNELKQAMTFLTTQQKATYEKGFKEAISQLKAERAAAREAGDHVTADELQDKIDEVKQQADELKVQQTQRPPGPSATFLAWKDKNEWYMKDKVLTPVADKLGDEYRKDNPDGNEAEMLAYVSKEIRKELPERFKIKGPPSPNSGGREATQRGNGNSSYQTAKSEMSDEARTIMRTVLKSTKMTEEEYMKQYLA